MVHGGDEGGAREGRAVLELLLAEEEQGEEHDPEKAHGVPVPGGAVDHDLAVLHALKEYRPRMAMTRPMIPAMRWNAWAPVMM